MASVKTYILAPNFTYHPDTSICMGDIIQNPCDPTKPLSSPALPAPPTESHLDFDADLHKHKNRSLQGSVWAKFLKSASSTLSGEVSGDVLDRYAIDRLETVYFRKQPTDEEATERIKDDKVKAAVRSGIFGKVPVYMITGLKIARGFRLESGTVSESRAMTATSAAVSSDASVGADLSARGKDDVQVSYRSYQDIIFAYQLHIITHQGLLRSRVDISLHKPKAAFLSEGDGPAEEGLAMVRGVTEDDMIAFDNRVGIEADIEDGDERCVCIVFKKDEVEDEDEDED